MQMSDGDGLGPMLKWNSVWSIDVCQGSSRVVRFYIGTFIWRSWTLSVDGAVMDTRRPSGISLDRHEPQYQ